MIEEPFFRNLYLQDGGLAMCFFSFPPFFIATHPFFCFGRHDSIDLEREREDLKFQRQSKLLLLIELLKYPPNNFQKGKTPLSKSIFLVGRGKYLDPPSNHV